MDIDREDGGVVDNLVRPQFALRVILCLNIMGRGYRYSVILLSFISAIILKLGLHVRNEL